ncbi:MAG TPA: universal stress protein [Gaiellaceae bacterium]|jgi:nucleotide-binding universal stress UspA family protein|nr:universal stress protein [Gaiellaceae bacterium]
MSATADHPTNAPEARSSIFGRVLVGIDDSPESLEAARQAATLARGPITLLAAYDLTDAVIGGAVPPAPVYFDEGPVRERAQESLERAKRELVPVVPVVKIAKGRGWEILLDEISDEHHTLVAVGSHGAGRAKGILIGSTATELIHKAPCPVLVARTPLKQFPSSIVVGVDGSKESAVADAVARDLAERFGAQLERYENLPNPVEGLVEAGMEADLLVVGSRGLHGIKALGSVSERVAHEARCSVLIVR